MKAVDERPAVVVVPDAVRERAAQVIHDSLFAETDDGPTFRWSEQPLCLDDDSPLKALPDAIVNDLVANPSVLAELLEVARNQPTDN